MSTSQQLKNVVDFATYRRRRPRRLSHATVDDSPHGAFMFAMPITPSKRRKILTPEGIQPQYARPIRPENRATSVTSIARGRRWLDELTLFAADWSERRGTRRRLRALCADLIDPAIHSRVATSSRQ
jgi:hypothetical protein